MTDAERRLSEEMKDAQTGRITEASIDLDQLHGLTTYPHRNIRQGL